jgi:hypothetical protein
MAQRSTPHRSFRIFSLANQSWSRSHTHFRIWLHYFFLGVRSAPTIKQARNWAFTFLGLALHYGVIGYRRVEGTCCLHFQGPVNRTRKLWHVLYISKVVPYVWIYGILNKFKFKNDQSSSFFRNVGISWRCAITWYPSTTVISYTAAEASKLAIAANHRGFQDSISIT